MTVINRQSLTDHGWLQVETHEFPEVLETITVYDVLEVQAEAFEEVKSFRENDFADKVSEFLGDVEAYRKAKKHAQIVMWSCDEYLELGCH